MHPLRKSPWISEAVWLRAKNRAEKNGAEFSRDITELVAAYARGDFDIDIRDLAEKDHTRAGRAFYPRPEEWKAAAARAHADYGISASMMAECLLIRYGRDEVRVQHTVTVIEVRPRRRNLENPPPPPRKAEPKAPRAA